MAHQTQRFVYSGKEVPPYGEEMQVLVKTAKAFTTRHGTTWTTF
jgi:hypothetical protein